MSGGQERCLATINFPPALEDSVIDWLLASDLNQGFTSYRADGHGSDHDGLSVREQVSGRQRRMECRLVLDSSRIERFVAALQAQFGSADIFYYVVPVLDTGHLGAER